MAWNRSNQHVPVDLSDDGVDIDLPSREEKVGALKYLTNNKAAGADSIAAWNSETLQRSWTEEVLFPVYKKGNKVDCKNYQGICLLNGDTEFQTALIFNDH
jgi:hypothetical protein